MAKPNQQDESSTDRVVDLAKDIFSTRAVSNHCKTPEQHAKDSFVDAIAFFAIADEQLNKPKTEK